MKAITIKYAGPTNTKGSRWIATAEGGAKPHKVTVSYDHALSSESNAFVAAKTLCDKLGWKGRLAIGQDAKGDYVAVFVEACTTFDV
jgi:hypothetical protein